MSKFCFDRHSARFQRSAVSFQRIPPFKISRLGVRFLILVIGTVFLGVLLSSALILSLKQQQLVDNTRVSVQHTSDVIWASLEHAMLSEDKPMLDGMFSTIAREAGANIRLVKTDGQIWLSSIPGESMKRTELNDPLCRACHLSTNISVTDAVVPTSQIYGDVLLNVSLIPNEPTCHGCHGSSQQSLGLLIFETPFADVQRELISSFWQIAIVAAIIFTLLAGLLTLVFNSSVIQPVAELAKSVKEFGAGNLDVQVPVKHSSDELGELATAFETMREQLKTALIEKEHRNQELRMLNEITRAASELLDPQQILDLTINIAVTSLGVPAGTIHLLNREATRFSLHACRGIPQCAETRCCLWSFDRAITGLQPSDSQPMFVSFPTDIGMGIGTDDHGHSFIGVPLKAKGVLVGAMSFITQPGQTLTDEGIKTLRTMGDEVGLALANAIHYQSARSQATITERERLAREMHDSLAQALGYLKMKASMTDDLLASGEITEAKANLQEVKQIAQETYFDVREAIFGLRRGPPMGSEFLPALETYLADYQLHYGLNVQLVVDDKTHPAFSAEVALQLVRIIQEALTNVRKHANSNLATIHFDRKDHHWRITVADQGVGFNPRETKNEGARFLGLHIMQERATGIGAELIVDSQPGSGTRVVVQVPFESEVS